MSVSHFKTWRNILIKPHHKTYEDILMEMFTKGTRA